MPEIISPLLSHDDVTVSPELITAFYNLGVALNCTRLQIDPDKLYAYCEKVKALWYKNNLGWYPMCSSVHKNIQHSAKSLKRLQRKSRVLTLGHLSETGQEVSVIA